MLIAVEGICIGEILAAIGRLYLNKKAILTKDYAAKALPSAKDVIAAESFASNYWLCPVKILL